MNSPQQARAIAGRSLVPALFVALTAVSSAAITVLAAANVVSARIVSTAAIPAASTMPVPTPLVGIVPQVTLGPMPTPLTIVPPPLPETSAAPMATPVPAVSPAAQVATTRSSAVAAAVPAALTSPGRDAGVSGPSIGGGGTSATTVGTLGRSVAPVPAAPMVASPLFLPVPNFFRLTTAPSLWFNAIIALLVLAVLLWRVRRVVSAEEPCE